MPVGAAVPKHLEKDAITGFLVSLRENAQKFAWPRLASVHNMDAKTVDMVDLGATPMPAESVGGFSAQDFIEKTQEVRPTDWDLTVWLSYNAMKDDQTGNLIRRGRAAGRNFQRHINKRVFEVLNAGDGTTYSLCYDGHEFFDSDHVDKGGEYQTAQDNENALDLSLSNFNTVWSAAQLFRDDQGTYTEYDYDCLICAPALYSVAYNVAKNRMAYDTANREDNPFAEKLTAPIITSPYLDASAWYLAASSEDIKPLIVAMREQPNLQSTWFDPNATDGGRYYFKFYARYEVFYGDWRLISQGNT